MAFVEDPAAFLEDFGVNVTAGAISGLGILDSPGEYVADDRVITDEYVLKVERSRFGSLGYNDVISVDGETFVVREAPLAVDDGVFCLLLLSKATGNEDYTYVLNGDFL